MSVATGPIPARQLPVPIDPILVGRGSSSGAVVISQDAARRDRRTEGYESRDEVVISRAARELAKQSGEFTDRATRVHVTGMKLMEMDSDAIAAELWDQAPNRYSSRYSYGTGIQQYAANQQVLLKKAAPLFDGFA